MSDFNKPTFAEYDNGVRLINVANRMLNTGTVGFTVGSRNDPKDFHGAAHLVEHEFICGASDAYNAAVRANNERAKLPRREAVSARRLVRAMRRYLGGTNGPGMNVSTMHSTVSYGHQDLLYRRYLRELFPLFGRAVADAMEDIYRMRGLRVIDDVVHTVERAAVDNETGENDDDVYLEAYKASLRLLYTTNPARYFGDSEPEQLARVKLGTLKHWAQRQFVAPNMVIILLGPTANEAQELFRASGLDNVPLREATPLIVDPKDIIPVLTGVRAHTIMRPKGVMTHAEMLWPTETYSSPDGLALELLSYVLKERVEEELRERNREFPGGSYHPHCNWDSSSTHGFLELGFRTKRDRAYADEALTRVLGVIERLKDDTSEPFEEDVDDFRRYLIDAYREMYRYLPAAMGDRMLEAVANGDTKLERLQQYPRDMAAVTAADIRRVARKYLHSDRFVRVVSTPYA